MPSPIRRFADFAAKEGIALCFLFLFRSSKAMVFLLHRSFDATSLDTLILRAIDR
jgi:hypothetical protein